MPTLEMTINNSSGLHARPAAKFVQMAASYPCEIYVRNVTAGGKPVNAKSILSVLALGVNQGCVIDVEASGDQSEEALHALKTLSESGFGE